MRKLGCCTWIFGGASLPEIAQRVAAAQLDGVELFGDINGVNATEAHRIFGDAGLEVFSITPGDADISHPDPTIRTPAIAYYDKLMDWAAELGQPLISCHGQVGRIRPITGQAEEDVLLADAVGRVCEAAAERELQVVFELLNRYETHQIRTVSEGLALIAEVGANNLRLLPDAYHMNIEESDSALALSQGGEKVGLYHAADSNRCGIGDGHTDFAAQIAALDTIGYNGPIILETNAPGPNPFTPDKGEGFRNIVERQLATSASKLAAMGA
ncbi:MAG: sugar phosphate isomerase/epimerase [Rhodobacteraceae bacterium]|nr:sugar phosphate isomerase/epimerase [Paracoccaceae bacterium]